MVPYVQRSPNLVWEAISVFPLGASRGQRLWAAEDSAPLEDRGGAHARNPPTRAELRNLTTQTPGVMGQTQRAPADHRGRCTWGFRSCACFPEKLDNSLQRPRERTP